MPQATITLSTDHELRIMASALISRAQQLAWLAANRKPPFAAIEREQLEHESALMYTVAKQITDQVNSR